MKRILLFLLLLVVTAAMGARLLFERLLELPGAPLAAPIRIDVAPGEPFHAAAERLEAAGLVPSGRALALWARFKGYDRQIQHGAYQFTEALSPLAVLDKMRSGEAMVLRVTLPEGFTARDMAMALEHLGLGSIDEYLALVHDISFARSLGVSAESLEGYLFPDTYVFSPLDGADKVLSVLVARFHQTFTPDLVTEAKTEGFTTHQIVTLASVIEKETGRDEERPMVAAVFRNRLKIGMPLQADPTVIYGIASFNGNLTRRDLETPTPYNTYRRLGLPPGPIASPGRAALLAALRPADVPYLYFVARDDGTHEFSATLAEHNRAVNRFQRTRRGNG